MGMPMHWICGLVCLLPYTGSFAAESPPDSDAAELTELRFDELMKLPVTSVSKRATKLEDAAAAIAVVTSDDIRRLGITTLPEALRLIPGMDVARINANEWAVAARGFNLQYSAKLLVLIDGRSVYTPTSAGVWWNDHNLPMSDIERIEVIRGSGATLWGANALNGVINIITRSAEETQGWHSSTSFGTEDQPSIEARYGGKIGERAFYRAYVKHFDRENFTDEAGNDMPDDWRMSLGGLRFDWKSLAADAFTLQGDYHTGVVGQPWQEPFFSPPYTAASAPRNRNRGGNALFRWTRTQSEDSSFTLQVYYDHFRHVDVGTVETRDTYDIDWQQRFAIGSRQTLTWGAGYRHTVDRLPPIFYLAYTPARTSRPLYSAFVQDEIVFAQERVTLTLGTKFEHHETVGLEVQPNVRMLWEVAEHQSLWGAVSRSIRTPSRYERDSSLNSGVEPADPPDLPIIYRVVGGGDLKPEEAVQYELGYRIAPIRALTLDATAFYNVYEDLIGSGEGELFFEADPAPDHFVFPWVLQNNGHGHTYGLEVAARWSVNQDWGLVASYTGMYMGLKPDDVYLSSGDSPEHQFHVRSYLDLPHDLELNAAAYYVGDLPNQRAPSYVRADLGMVWRPTHTVELGIWGTNLLERRHFEFGTYTTPVRTVVPRSVSFRVNWQPDGDLR
jgi:iron complex outermembrane recepter protein